MTKARFQILLLALLVPSAFLRAQWYEKYEKGREAVKKEQWQQAVRHLSEALDDESDSKANKKMYGLQFIDYFPYLYRGIAYYRLGDMVKARADLEKAKNEGAIDDAQRDTEAPALLTEYLSLIQKPEPQTAQQKTPQKTPQNLPQNPSPAPPQADLKKVEAAQKKNRVDKAFAAGVEFFKGGELDRAEEQFKIVLGEDSGHPGAANFLKRIRTRREKLAAAAAVQRKEIPDAAPHEPLRTERATAPDTAGAALFRDAVELFEAGKIGRAKAEFRSVQSVAPSYPDLAKYMALIVSAENNVHQGIAAYFDGEYAEAIERLGSSSKSGNDNPHVYAFLACSYAAEYLLAGAENGNLKKEAVDAFGRVKGIDPRYELDAALISPGIIALLTGE